MKRRAACSCGQLSVHVDGDPTLVIACNCLKCQVRTGSVFAVSAYFDDAQIAEIIGHSTSLKRSNAAGVEMERRFCPICGSTVLWKADITTPHTGIAVGAFADPGFPEPTLSLCNESRHAWVSFPERIRSMSTSA